MAVTGLALLCFLLIHAFGTSSILRGPSAFISYSNHLQELGLFLTLSEILLFSIFFLHITIGLTLFSQNQQGRSMPYAGRKPLARLNYPALLMPYSGIILLVFLVIHLADFQFHRPDQRLVDLVFTTLRSLPHTLFYLLGLMALALHLWHGFWSLFQTLGVSHSLFDPFIRRLGFLFTVSIFFVFLAIVLQIHTSSSPLQ